MADKIPIRGGFSGASLTGLAQFASGDTLGVAHGGTGIVTIGSNQLVTGNGTSAITSESNLTFDGTTLATTAFTATGNVSLDGGTFVFNESGADKDFRIEGDTEANLFITDASVDRIGIGTATPSHLVDIEGVAHAATCFVSADLCATTKVVSAALCVGSQYALPAADGSAGQLMCTDGSGALAFASGSGSGADPGSTNTWTADQTFNDNVKITLGTGGDADLYYDGTNVVLNGGTFVFNESGADKDFRIEGDTNTHLFFTDASTDRVGIGTNAPAGPLQIAYTCAETNIRSENMGLWIRNLDVTGGAQAGLQMAIARGGGGYEASGAIYMYSTGGGGDSCANALGFATRTGSYPTEKMTITGTGKVGIATASPAYLMEVKGAGGNYDFVANFHNTNATDGAGVKIQTVGTAGSPALAVYGNDGSTPGLRVQNNGNVGIGTTSPASYGAAGPSLDIYKSDGTCNVVLVPCILNFCNIGGSVTGAALGGIHFGGRDSASNGQTYACLFGCIYDATSGAEQGMAHIGIMCVNSAGSPMKWLYACTITTGCMYISQCLCVAGCIGAPTKNFEIEHPLASDESPNKYNQQRLIHSTLEGPEYGVYYRGTGQLDNGAAQIDLPEYFEALADKESATIQFTPVFGLSNLTIKSNDDCAVIYNNKFCVCTDASGNQNQCFHWFVQGRRIDKHIVCTIAQGDRPGACDDGRLCVERWQYREELVGNLNSEGLESMTCAELNDFISFNNTWDNDDPVFLSDYENVSKANKILMIGTAVGAVRDPASHEGIRKGRDKE